MATLLDKARAMMHSAGLSLGFWEFAIDTAVHTYNRTPQRSIQWCHATPSYGLMGMSRKNLATSESSDLSFYMHTPEDKQKKKLVRDRSR